MNSANTITFTPKLSNSFWTAAELNALFLDVQNVLNGKVKVTSPEVNQTLFFVDGGGIINVKTEAVFDLQGKTDV